MTDSRCATPHEKLRALYDQMKKEVRASNFAHDDRYNQGLWDMMLAASTVCEQAELLSAVAKPDPDEAAKALFLKNAKGFNHLDWSELHDDTRQLWRDEAAKRCVPTSATCSKCGASESEPCRGNCERRSTVADEPRFQTCKDHKNVEWNQPRLDDDDCILCRLFYLEAQESLLEEWQQRAKRAEDALAEVQRPLDEQMARLNATVTRLNAENDALRSATAMPESQDVSKEEAIRRARYAHAGVWPEQLESGVMFYLGHRITREEFRTRPDRTRSTG